jgi:very-short-patch-repair endonuclease
MDEPVYHQPHPALWEKLKPLAREKRHEPTPAEDHLWQQLRGRQVAGVKFRRQHAIDKFIVDFFCVEAHLAIEVDGLIHQYNEVEDAVRQEFLESMGIQVLRFTNEQVLESTDLVLKAIIAVCTATTKGNPSPQGGEGQG